MIGFHGPKDKWEYDLEKMSRAALVATGGELQWRLAIYRESFDRDTMSEILDRCKLWGRWDNLSARHARFMADPAKATEQFIRRQKSAKAAARRRKKAAKKRLNNGTL